MRIAIYDGIQEAHLSQSLRRALEARGHEVFDTGRFGKGFHFPTLRDDLEILEMNAQEVVDFKPDLVIVFRPASAPSHILKRFTNAGAQIFAWLCDDPVLWELSYRENASAYDALLHCGDQDVINLYDEHLGRAGGVNFPFWTDHVAFPYSYGKAGFDSDVVFLGNAQGQLRRRRYHELVSLELDVKIHGLSGYDYSFVNGGYLDSDREVIESCSRSRFALNFPQYFSDHQGLETWFPGLDRFEYFPFPSRVIQYAAMGIPTVCIVPSVDKIRHFPELIAVRSINEAQTEMQERITAGELRELSLLTHERFEMNFSAMSRALAIENLVESDDWRALDSRERSEWFTQFDGRENVYGHSDLPKEKLTFSNAYSLSLSKEQQSSQRYAISNVSSSEGYFSLAEILNRGLMDAGWQPADCSEEIEDNSDVTEFVICDDLADLNDLNKPTDHLVKYLRRCLFVREGNLRIDEEHVHFLDQFAFIIVRTSQAKNVLISAGATNSQILVKSYLYEASAVPRFLNLKADDNVDTNSVTAILPEQKSNLTGEVIHDFELFDQSGSMETIVDFCSVDDLANALKQTRSIVTSAEKTGASNIIPDWFGYLALTRLNLFYARTLRQYSPTGLGERYLTVANSGELPRKIARLQSRVDASPWLGDLSLQFDAVEELSVEKLLSQMTESSEETRIAKEVIDVGKWQSPNGVFNLPLSSLKSYRNFELLQRNFTEELCLKITLELRDFSGGPLSSLIRLRMPGSLSPLNVIDESEIFTVYVPSNQDWSSVTLSFSNPDLAQILVRVEPLSNGDPDSNLPSLIGIGK